MADSNNKLIALVLILVAFFLVFLGILCILCLLRHRKQKKVEIFEQRTREIHTIVRSRNNSFAEPNTRRQLTFTKNASIDLSIDRETP